MVAPLSQDDSSDGVWCVECSPAMSDAGITEEVLAALEASCSSFTDVQRGTVLVRVFAADPADAEALAQRLNAGMEPFRDLFAGAPPTLVPRQLVRQDWAESWKEHFHAFRASRRLVVKPSWETHEAGAADIVLDIDPGMCFGTGYHGTTRACLEFLDDLAVELGPASLLDVGCGSGILSLAAARLGYQPVRGFDLDPDAVRIASENLDRCGVRGVDLAVSDIAAYQAEAPCRVVTANVLSHVLVAHRDRLVSWIDTSGGAGYLLLAGILTEQYPSVRRAFEDLGVQQLRQRTIDEWTSGWFQLTGKSRGGRSD